VAAKAQNENPIYSHHSFRRKSSSLRVAFVPVVIFLATAMFLRPLRPRVLPSGEYRRVTSDQRSLGRRVLDSFAPSPQWCASQLTALMLLPPYPQEGRATYRCRYQVRTVPESEPVAFSERGTNVPVDVPNLE